MGLGFCSCITRVNSDLTVMKYGTQRVCVRSEMECMRSDNRRGTRGWPVDLLRPARQFQNATQWLTGISLKLTSACGCHWVSIWTSSKLMHKLIRGRQRDVAFCWSQRGSLNTEKAIKPSYWWTTTFRRIIQKHIYCLWSLLSPGIERACSTLVSQKWTFTRLRGRGAFASGSIGDIPNQESVSPLSWFDWGVWLILIDSTRGGHGSILYIWQLTGQKTWYAFPGNRWHLVKAMLWSRTWRYCCLHESPKTHKDVDLLTCWEVISTPHCNKSTWV